TRVQRRPEEHGLLTRPSQENTDAVDLPRLLRLDGERRGEETASQRAEKRPARRHWITSSARWSIDGGIVRPSALAVFRLITSSTLVGGSIGRWAGLAPLRILPT